MHNDWDEWEDDDWHDIGKDITLRAHKVLLEMCYEKKSAIVPKKKEEEEE